MRALHDLAAHELSAAYRSGRALAGRGDARGAGPHRGLGEEASTPCTSSTPTVRWRWRRLRRSGGARRKPLSALDGVPITIKDNIAAKGIPTPVGTAAGDMTPSASDAPPAARVREAGCVMLGKTTMPDFGMLASGVSSLHGITRNPWNLTRNPAGSSSGAGAGDRRRLRAAGARHRHRRLGAAAGGV